MFLMAFLVISVKFGKHRPLPKRKEDAEKENYKRQNDICRSKCRNSKIFCCVPAYHSHSIIDYKKIHIHLLQFAFLLLILKIKQLYIILKSTTDRCSPTLFTKLSSNPRLSTGSFCMSGQTTSFLQTFLPDQI